MSDGAGLGGTTGSRRARAHAVGLRVRTRAAVLDSRTVTTMLAVGGGWLLFP